MTAIRVESDGLGKVEVPVDKLRGAQTQCSLEHFSIGHDRWPLVRSRSRSDYPGFIARLCPESEFDRVVDPAKMFHPYVAHVS
jgi:hypothetical protein